MNRRLSRWLAPLVRRILAPELTDAEYLEELQAGDRADRLLNSVATWFAVIALAGVAELVLLPFINVSTICDRLSSALIAAMFLCVIPVFAYSLALAVENARERREDRRRDPEPGAQDQ
ncbi:MAG: hypothetical protein WCD35_08725 [Mycobacteriales bacterium]